MIATRRLGPLSGRGSFSTTSDVFQTALSINNRSGVCVNLSVWGTWELMVRILVDGVEVHHSVVSPQGGERQPGVMWFFATTGALVTDSWGGASQIDLGFSTSLVIQVRSATAGWSSGIAWYVEVEPV